MFNENDICYRYIIVILLGMINLEYKFFRQGNNKHITFSRKDLHVAKLITATHTVVFTIMKKLQKYVIRVV